MGYHEYHVRRVKMAELSTVVGDWKGSKHQTRLYSEKTVKYPQVGCDHSKSMAV